MFQQFVAVFTLDVDSLFVVSGFNKRIIGTNMGGKGLNGNDMAGMDPVFQGTTCQHKVVTGFPLFG